jgi:hypothetical protein
VIQNAIVTCVLEQVDQRLSQGSTPPQSDQEILAEFLTPNEEVGQNGNSEPMEEVCSEASGGASPQMSFGYQNRRQRRAAMRAAYGGANGQDGVNGQLSPPIDAETNECLHVGVCDISP